MGFEIYRRLLKNSNFIKVWLSQIFSQRTFNAINFILINQIFERTHSTVAVSVMWIFYSLPAIFIGPFSGFFVDIWDKRKIMLITNFLQALTVISLLAVQQHFYFLYVVVFTYSVLNQFYMPSEAAVIPEVVNKKILPAANSLFLFTAQLSFLVGFGMASILLQFLSRQEMIVSAAALLLAAVLAVAMLPKNKLISQRRQRYSWDQFSHDIQEGGHFLLRGGRLVLIGFIVIALFQMATSAAATILPVLADTILHRSLQQAGVVMVVPLATGLIGGSYLFSRAAQRIRKKHWIIGGSIGSGAVIISVALLDYFSQRYFWRALMAGSFLFLLCIGLASVVVPAQTFIQEFTPAKIRGRVFSLLNVTMNLAAIVPLLLMATIIDILGIRLLLLAIGSIAIGLGLLISFHSDVIISNTNHRP